MDIARLVSDRSGETNLMGFMKPSDLPYAEAVRASNQREERRLEVRFLANLFVLVDDERLREMAQAAIKAFPENLPFGFQEEANDQEQVAELRRTAEIWSEFGKIENYAMTPAPDGSSVYIEMRSPKAADPDVVAVQERQSRMHRQLTLINWVTQSLEKKELSDSLGMIDVLEQAKAIDSRTSSIFRMRQPIPTAWIKAPLQGWRRYLVVRWRAGRCRAGLGARSRFSRRRHARKARCALVRRLEAALPPLRLYRERAQRIDRKGIDLRASKHALVRLAATR